MTKADAAVLTDSIHVIGRYWYLSLYWSIGGAAIRNPCVRSQSREILSGERTRDPGPGSSTKVNRDLCFSFSFCAGRLVDVLANWARMPRADSAPKCADQHNSNFPTDVNAKYI